MFGNESWVLLYKHYIYYLFIDNITSAASVYPCFTFIVDCTTVNSSVDLNEPKTNKKETKFNNNLEKKNQNKSVSNSEKENNFRFRGNKYKYLISKADTSH